MDWKGWLAFDVEGNELLEDVTRIWCVVIRDLHTGEYEHYVGDAVSDAVRRLEGAAAIVGHNALGYDVPALAKVCGFKLGTTDLYDTEVLARLAFSDILLKDEKVGVTPVDSHRLKDWGRRLGLLKGDFGEEIGFAQWDDRMLPYCEQDVRICSELIYTLAGCKSSAYQSNLRLGPKLVNGKLNPVYTAMEFAKVGFAIEQRGFEFDMEKAEELRMHIANEMEQQTTQLREWFPDTVEVMKTPQYWDCHCGAHYVRGRTKAEADKARKAEGWAPKDCEFHKGPPKEKRHPFNPGSRDQVAARLKEKYGWKPTKFTDKGKPSIDADVLGSLSFAEGPVLADYYINKKVMGQLATGPAAWMRKAVKVLPGRWKLRHRMITIGANTHRVAHSGPNIAQVPAVDEDKPEKFGKECRSLFGPTPGWVMVGADLSGIEARLLAHYMKDDRWTDILLNGDIHTHHQEMAGLATRQQAKTFFYALIYGAGVGKIGAIAGGGKKAGQQLMDKFQSNMPAFRNLLTQVRTAASLGRLKLIDGRYAMVRSPHSALNVLLQGSAAVIAKGWTCCMYQRLNRRQWKPLAFVHDEVQSEAWPTYAEEAGRIMCSAADDVGKHFGVSIPLAAEAKVGANWADTH